MLKLSLVALVVLFPSMALAQKWRSGSVPGEFSSAIAACKAATADQLHYVLTGTAEPESESAREQGMRMCMIRPKDNDKAKPEVHSSVWPEWPKEDEAADEKPDAGAGSTAKKEEGCGPDVDLSWFPSIEKTALKAAAAQVQADIDPGSCNVRSGAAGGRLFSGSKKKVRCDRLKKEAQPVGEHYFLRYQGLIIDPTFLQFFRVHDRPGLVFAGSEAQLVEAADKLFQLCGANPKTNDSKNGNELKAANFDGAKLCNAGSTLVLRESGFGEYASTTCDAK